MAREPNKEDAPYRPWKPGPHDKPPPVPNPKPKLAEGKKIWREGDTSFTPG